MKRLCLLVLFVGCNQSAPVAPSKLVAVPAAAKSEFAPQAAPATEPQPEPLANFQVGGPCNCIKLPGGPPTCQVTLSGGWSSGTYVLQCAGIKCAYVYDNPAASTCQVRQIVLEIRQNTLENKVFEVKVFPSGRPGYDSYMLIVAGGVNSVSGAYESRLNHDRPARCFPTSDSCVVN